MGRDNGESVKCFDLIMLGLQPEWAIFRDVWKDFMGQNNSLGWNRLKCMVGLMIMESTRGINV